VTKSEQLAESVETNVLLAFIEQNDLADGDKLPPERELASELGISRRALRHKTGSKIARLKPER